MVTVTIVFIEELFQTWYFKCSSHRNQVGNHSPFFSCIPSPWHFPTYIAFLSTYFDYSRTLHSGGRKANKSKAFQIYQLTQQTVHNSIHYLYHSIRPLATNSLCFFSRGKIVVLVKSITTYSSYNIWNITWSQLKLLWFLSRGAGHFNLTSTPRSILFGLMR